MLRRRSKSIIEKFESNDIIRICNGANFFGQEKYGAKQVRGNGVLILTPDKLFFEMWFPKKELSIPFKDITSVETTKWHLKKSKNRLLLKVLFTNDVGKTDSGAWLVQELDSWVQALEQLQQRNRI